jgi:endonuclease YncB( thermonuclease family)
MELQDAAEDQIHKVQGDILPSEVERWVAVLPKTAISTRGHMAASPLMDPCPPIAPIGLADYHVAEVQRVVDGDTVICRIHLGFGIQIIESIRLAGIDAPEVSGNTIPAGQASRAALMKLCLKQIVVLKTWHGYEDKHGRPLAILWLYGDKESLNRKQLEAGHAIKYFGGTKGVKSPCGC